MAQQHLSFHSNFLSQHDAFHLQNQRAEPQHITNPPLCAGQPYSTVSHPRIRASLRWAGTRRAAAAT